MALLTVVIALMRMDAVSILSFKVLKAYIGQLAYLYTYIQTAC